MTSLTIYHKKGILIKITPLILILLNLIIKMLYISTSSIGGDEPFSVYHAQMDVASIISHLTQGNNPPTYEILLHFWIKIFGISELSIRFPSVFFSALTVFYIFNIGEKFFAYEVGLVAALLFSFSNFNVLLAHEARVYAMFSFFVAASMYYFLEAIRNPKKHKYYLLILGCNTLICYLHYFGFFIVFLQTVAFILLKDVRINTYKNYCLYLLAFGILYIPNTYILVTRFLDSTVHGTWISPPNGLNSVYNMLRTFSNQPLTTVFCILIFVGAGVKSFFKHDENPNRIYKQVILLWFLFLFIFMFVISYWIPMFFDRYLIFVSLGYYLSVSILSLSLLSQKKYKFIVPGVTVILFLVTFNPNMDNKRHVKETVSKIVELKTDSTSVIIFPSSFVINFAYYYNKSIFADVDAKTVYDKMIVNLRKENVFSINSINSFSSYSKRIIYFDAAADFGAPNNNILSTLNTQYRLLNTYKFYEIFNVYEFEKL